MRRSMFAVLVIAIGIGSAFADRKKSSNADDTPPMPAAANAVVQAADKVQMTLPSPHYLAGQYPQFFPIEGDFAQESTTQAKPNDRAAVKVYSVGDLVVPLPCVGMCEKDLKATKTLEAELIARIKLNVRSKSWKGAGGEGTLEYFPIGMALVVNQLPSVHAELEKFLETERRHLDQQVMLQVRFITVSDEWFENSGVRKALLKDGEKPSDVTPTKVISPQVVERLLRSATENPQTTVLQAPRMNCLTGQLGRIKVCDTEHFLTGVNIQVVEGSLVFEPKNEPHDLGVNFSVEPTVAEDGKTIRLAISGGLRELAVKPVPMTPITLPIHPVKEKGEKGETVPFTQFIQQPKFVNRNVSSTCSVNDGSTVLMYAGKATLTETLKEPAPMLKDVPALGELFARERKDQKTNHLLVLVTSRVVSSEMLEVEQVKPVNYDARLEKLMSAYSKACEQGNTNEARRLAIECVAMDPMCFSKR